MTARTRVLLALALCGLVINLLLLYWKLSDSDLENAGCGGSDGCNSVLSSPWSMILGLPVTLPGALVYAVLCALLIAKRNAAFCYAVLMGSALWMIGIQAVVLHQFCKWCMTAHVIGLSVAILGLWWGRRTSNDTRPSAYGVAAVVCFALFQLFGPSRGSHAVDAENASIPRAALHEEGSGRKISFDDGRRVFNAERLPCLGTPQARHVMVEYFDYRCPACRKMGAYLTTLVDRHPNDIAVLLLPTPLDHECNPGLPENDLGHPRSCRLAKIALAVWHVQPAAFPALHRALITGPPLDEAAAMELARKAIAPADLDAALRDPWIGRLIAADIADWKALSGRNHQLPKLLIRDKRILHGLPSGEADFIRVMELELGL